MRTRLHTAWLSVLLMIMLLAMPEHGWSLPLPLNKKLTVRLSTLSSAGVVHEVAGITSTTDAYGKIGFSFPTVPAANVTTFLHLQIMDGTDVLRQTIVPAPLPGEHLDMGISETTDLQARALLKAATLSGRITYLHLLVTQTLIRSPETGAAAAEAAAPAINAGAEAFTRALDPENLTGDQFSSLMAGIRKGLALAAARYRTAVDEAVLFDADVEAYRRGEAYALLLQELISSGRAVGLAREPLAAAFAAVGSGTEDSLDTAPAISPVARAVMRLGLVNDILCLSNLQTIRDTRDALAYAGIVRPRFDRAFFTIDLMERDSLTIQMGLGRDLGRYMTLTDMQQIRIQEYNALARQDLLLFKVYLDLSQSYSAEYGDLMLELTNRMTAIGGIMAGMTPETLLGILGQMALPPPFVFKSQNTVQLTAPVPTLRPLPLAAWAFIHNEPDFRYTPVAGLADQLATPVTVPAFERLVEPYRSLALLGYDTAVATALRWQDVQAADAYSTAHPLDPPGWYRLSAVYQIQEQHRQRMAMIRRQVAGVTPDAREALLTLVKEPSANF